MSCRRTSRRSNCRTRSIESEVIPSAPNSLTKWTTRPDTHMSFNLPELMEKGGADGTVGESSAVRTLGGFYALIEADDNLTADKKEMLAEIVAGAYTRLLSSRRS